MVCCCCLHFPLVAVPVVGSFCLYLFIFFYFFVFIFLFVCLFCVCVCVCVCACACGARARRGMKNVFLLNLNVLHWLTYGRVKIGWPMQQNGGETYVELETAHFSILYRYCCTDRDASSHTMLHDRGYSSTVMHWSLLLLAVASSMGNEENPWRLPRAPARTHLLTCDVFLAPSTIPGSECMRT